MATLNEIFHLLIDDRRIGSRHISVFLALLQLKEREPREGPFYIRREEVMRFGKIQGRTTYYRVMGELDAWGYIEYWPSCRNEGRTKVFLPVTAERQ